MDKTVDVTRSKITVRAVERLHLLAVTEVVQIRTSTLGVLGALNLEIGAGRLSGKCVS